MDYMKINIKVQEEKFNKGKIMTTSIYISAYCTSDKEVLVRQVNSYCGEVIESMLQNGETGMYNVYDEWILSVKEILK